jgi:CDP-glycerol glycerophosphotransferase (TagB/SpsB family)
MFAVLERFWAKARVLLIAVRFACLYPLSFLIPRDRSLWVYGSNNGAFTDNSKYLFLWMAEYRSDIRSVWIAKSEAVCERLRGLGYRVYHHHSLMGVWTRLRAGVYIYSYGLQDIGPEYVGNAAKVNLWHGVGLKNIEFKIKTGATARYYNPSALNAYRLITPEKYIRPDLFVCPSGMMEEHFIQAFRLNDKNALRAGYPRNDFGNDVGVAAIRRRVDDVTWYQEIRQSYRRVVLYMPTFRDSKKRGIKDALGDIEELDAVLRSTGTVLLVKAHPAEMFTLRGEYSSIRVLPNNCDIYPVLGAVDALVTDYSSILYDYIAMGGTRIVLYTYDFEEYVSGSRDFAYPYLENTVGTRVSSFSELCTALTVLDVVPATDLERIKERFWGYANTNSCKAISEGIERLIGSTSQAIEDSSCSKLTWDSKEKVQSASVENSLTTD